MRESVVNIEWSRHDHCLRESQDKRKGWGWRKVSLTKNEKKNITKGDSTMNSKKNEGVILVGDGILLGSD